jgi:pteridine reductase
VKLALVTGGYRRLGAAIAARLATEGWTLALHYRPKDNQSAPEPEEELTRALQDHQTRWHHFPADLANGDAVVALIPEITAYFGAPPSLLINNASCFANDDAKNITGQELAHYHSVNVSAPVILATALAKILPAEENACVINILDQRVRQPGVDQLGYTLSKQALWMATDTLARALAPHVRVNAVAPGLTLPTPDYHPEQMRAIAREMPLNLLPTPQDVADAVLWLQRAKATTGQTIFVDGGANLKSFARDFLFMGI